MTKKKEPEKMYNPNTPNYVEPQWFRDHGGRLCYWRGGPVEPGAMWDMDNCIVIDYRMVNQLIPFLKDQGLLSGLMDSTNREDDVKIIHRLIDLLETKKK